MKNHGGVADSGWPLLIWLGIVIVGVIGWILNILDVANSDFGTITGLIVLRVIGIFIAPLGVVLGYFT